MDTSLNLSLKTEQNLSPQMLQALALLPMPILELKAHIQNQIESNPALEIPESEFESAPESNDSNDSDDYESDEYDIQASDRKQKAMENTAIAGESLSDHLLKQLGIADIPDRINEIGELLIGNLDSNGFYIVPLETLFEGSDYSQKEIDEAVSTVQSFEPSGICVKDFRESLVLQAKQSKMASEDLEIFTKIVYEQMDNLKNNKLSEAAASLRISKDDLETFFTILKSFTPFPGSAYSADSESYIEPEFSIKTIDGKLTLEMNNSALPKLEISEEFANLAKNNNTKEGKEAASYISDCIKQAKTLINQIELRSKTMANTASVILEKQHDFFVSGPSALKTLTLKEVADEVGVHETTISRLSQSKWVETDFGLLPLKYFFSQGVSSSDGEESVSRNAVKDMISKIIKEKGNLSDQKISDALLEMGIKCARRTVSKYRNELNIDSSFSRK